MRAPEMWQTLGRLESGDRFVTILLRGNHIISGTFESYRLFGRGVELTLSEYLSSGTTMNKRRRLDTWILGAEDLIAIRISSFTQSAPNQ